MTQSTQPVTNTSKFTAKIKNKHQKWTQWQHHSAALHCSSPWPTKCRICWRPCHIII